MRSLLWKEWHEQSWKLAFSCILLGAMAAIGLHSRIISDSDMMIWVCVIGMLLPISYCSGLLPAERADGYLESLVALPVQPRKILLAKTALGMTMCVLPLLLAMGISLAIAGSREADDGQIIALFSRSIFASVIFFMWMFALTSQLPGETRATLVSLGIWLCLAMVAVGLAEEFNSDHAASMLTPLFFGLEPAVTNQSKFDVFWGVLIQGAIALLLWFWTERHFTISAKELA
jgi:ABC-type transport system involved in multi-copper enzyme maturation permease subunit